MWCEEKVTRNSQSPGEDDVTGGLDSKSPGSQSHGASHHAGCNPDAPSPACPQSKPPRPLPVLGSRVTTFQMQGVEVSQCSGQSSLTARL